MKHITLYLVLCIGLPYWGHSQISSSTGQHDTVAPVSESIQSIYSIIETNNNCHPDTPFGGSVVVINEYDTIIADTSEFVQSQRPARTEDDRAVYWLHGLNGNEAAWAWARAQFSADNGTEQADSVVPRKIVNSGDLFYANYQTNTILTAAANFRSEFSLAFPSPTQLPNRDRTRSIGFGHSQGGLMLRALDYHYRMNPQGTGIPDMGGFVTFCTSNQGAHLVENGEDMIDYVKKFSADVAEGRIEQLDDFIPGWIQVFGIDLNSEKISSLIADSLFSWFGGTITNSQLPKITTSYAPGAPSLEALNSYETTMEAILAVASERPLIVTTEATYNDGRGNRITASDFPVPISWATLEFFLTPPNESDPFEAHLREHELAVSMHEMRMQYLANQMREEEEERSYRKKARKAYIDAAIFGIFCPVCKPCCVKSATALAFAISNEGNANDADQNAKAFGRGVEAFDQFDLNYRVALGLRTFEEQIQGTEEVCECTDISGIVRITPVPISGDCDDAVSDPRNEICAKVNRSIITQQWVDHPSDGVLRVASQKEIPQANKSVIIRQELPTDRPGSTHMAIRNDVNGRDMLIEIFEGKHGLFFDTKERE